MTTFVDTNVLVYVVDRTDRRKNEIACLILGDDSLVISTQVLNEFVAVVRRKFPEQFTWPECAVAVDTFSRWRVVTTDTQIVRNAITIASNHQISYWDSLILAAASQAKCDTILTEDLQAGTEIMGIRIVNPFVESP